MNRRKLLIGLGAAAGAGGVLGSGAFTSVTANRTATVNVTGDANAYLQLRKAKTDSGSNTENSEYASVSSGTLALDFSENNETSGGGTGLGQNSVYTFDDVFEIGNLGTQDVGVTADVIGVEDHDGIDEFTLYDSSDETEFSESGAKEGNEAGDSATDGPAVDVPVGERISVGIRISTTDSTKSGDSLDVVVTADESLFGSSSGGSGGSGGANGVTVGKDEKIADKLNNNGDGTTFLLADTTYEESLDISTKDVTLKPNGDVSPTIKDTSGERNVVSVSSGATGVTLEGLELVGQSSHDSGNLGTVVYSKASGLTIRDSTIRMVVGNPSDGKVRGPTGGVISFDTVTIEGTDFVPEFADSVSRNPKEVYRTYDGKNSGALHDYAVRITNTYATASSVVRDCVINRAKDSKEDPRDPSSDSTIRNGIFLTNARDILIENCDINDCTRRLDFPQDSEPNGEYRSGSGVNVQSKDRGDGPKVAKNIRIKDNELRNNGTGVFLDAQLGAGIEINENDIVGNSMAVTTFFNEQTPDPLELPDPVRTGIVLNQGRTDQVQQQIDAELNWYGSPAGPLLGDKVLANADVVPWYDGESDDDPSPVFEEPE
jgi:hypothetical protein